MRKTHLALLSFAAGCQAPTAPNPGCTLRFEKVIQFSPFIAMTVDQCLPVCPPNAEHLADSLKLRLIRDTPCPKAA